METAKKDRMLEIFFRFLHGEAISVKQLALEYSVSTKSISRDLSEIQAFLAEHRELMQNAELRYSYKEKAYTMHSDEFLHNSELFALVKLILGCRCFPKEQVLLLLEKLKRFTTTSDHEKLNKIMRKEVYHYHEVKSDCPNVIDHLWALIQAIDTKQLITVTYYKMNREEVKRKIKPAAVMFSEYYFYLIAYAADDENDQRKYFRIDRITAMTLHREHFALDRRYDFDEGDLRKREQFMFPGIPMKIRFAFSGLSLQAILDRLPTAKVIEKNTTESIIEAEVNYGRGLLMYLLSQGAWVKILSPQPLIDDMKAELTNMQTQYK